ncbi:50S ribosomal protein L2 [archaeon]|nr:50S ribosomal protein L2 [archaeon]
MGKRLIQQRRGRGTLTYKSPSHRYKTQVKHRSYDKIEKENVIYGKIINIVHCPGHSSPLAKIAYENGEKAYIFAPEGIRVTDIIASGNKAEVQPANTLPLKNIPKGTLIFNIEQNPGDGGKFIRSSGNFGRIVSNIKNRIIVEMPSKKQKTFLPNCRATIGVLAGSGRVDKPFVKAGKKFHAMKAKNKLYPKTSGVAMNAVDHPFGSGRGRHIGKPKTPPRNAPAGRNVGLIRAKRTGRKR